jgi:hypothetical protein
MTNEEWFRQQAAERGITLVSDEDFFVTLLDHIDSITAERDAIKAAVSRLACCEPDEPAADEAWRDILAMLDLD